MRQWIEMSLCKFSTRHRISGLGIFSVSKIVMYGAHGSDCVELRFKLTMGRLRLSLKESPELGGTSCLLRSMAAVLL